VADRAEDFATAVGSEGQGGMPASPAAHGDRQSGVDTEARRLVEEVAYPY
jgi:hypothetical protein